MLAIEKAIDWATSLAGKPCPKTNAALWIYINGFIKGFEDEYLAAQEAAIRSFAEREQADRWI
jgi:hypothetical protein